MPHFNPCHATLRLYLAHSLALPLAVAPENHGHSLLNPLSMLLAFPAGPRKPPSCLPPSQMSQSNRTRSGAVIQILDQSGRSGVWTLPLVSESKSNKQNPEGGVPFWSPCETTNQRQPTKDIRVWVKINPPGIAPQVLVHASIYQDSIFGTYS